MTDAAFWCTTDGRQMKRSPGAATGIENANAYGAAHYLLDTHTTELPGGTGTTFDWSALKSVGTTCFVAGGLRPDNVAQAIAVLAPYAVDVSSGVEFPSGSGKDPRLIRAFVEAVRSYDHRAN